MSINNNNADFLCIVVICSPYFFICSPSRHLCPPLRVGHKMTWRAANEKMRAANNYDARKISVIITVNPENNMS